MDRSAYDNNGLPPASSSDAKANEVTGQSKILTASSDEISCLRKPRNSKSTTQGKPENDPIKKSFVVVGSNEFQTAAALNASQVSH